MLAWLQTEPAGSACHTYFAVMKGGDLARSLRVCTPTSMGERGKREEARRGSLGRVANPALAPPLSLGPPTWLLPCLSLRRCSGVGSGSAPTQMLPLLAFQPIPTHSSPPNGPREAGPRGAAMRLAAARGPCNSGPACFCHTLGHGYLSVAGAGSNSHFPPSSSPQHPGKPAVSPPSTTDIDIAARHQHRHLHLPSPAEIPRRCWNREPLRESPSSPPLLRIYDLSSSLCAPCTSSLFGHVAL